MTFKNGEEPNHFDSKPIESLEGRNPKIIEERILMIGKNNILIIILYMCCNHNLKSERVGLAATILACAILKLKTLTLDIFLCSNFIIIYEYDVPFVARLTSKFIRISSNSGSGLVIDENEIDIDSAIDIDFQLLVIFPGVFIGHSILSMLGLECLYRVLSNILELFLFTPLQFTFLFAHI